jgi:hypothetical protein
VADLVGGNAPKNALAAMKWNGIRQKIVVFHGITIEAQKKNCAGLRF